MYRRLRERVYEIEGRQTDDGSTHGESNRDPRSTSAGRTGGQTDRQTDTTRRRIFRHVTAVIHTHGWDEEDESEGEREQRMMAMNRFLCKRESKRSTQRDRNLTRHGTK